MKEKDGYWTKMKNKCIECSRTYESTKITEYCDFCEEYYQKDQQTFYKFEKKKKLEK